MNNAVTTRAAALGRWGQRTAEFLGTVRAELQKVTWPTREELVKATRMIIVLSLALGLVIGLMDTLLNKILVDGIARLTR